MDADMSGSHSGLLQLAEPTGETWSFCVAGDCVYNGPPSPSPIGSEITTRIDEGDLSVVNLEGAIPVDDSIPKVGPQKGSSSTIPSVLADAGFDVVTLANNHAMDYGTDGLVATTERCEAAGLDTVGAGNTLSDALSPRYYTVDGAEIAVVNACEREFGTATENTPGTAWIGHPDAKRTVETASQRADAVILLAHGGIEYVPLPPLQWQHRLRRLADLGADLVVAHHPHVPQGWEIYGETPIFYSLGNFLFDHKSREKPNWGLTLDVSFDGEKPVAVELLVTEDADECVNLMADEARRAECLSHLHRLADLTGDPDALAAHWQELAVRLFRQRYTSWLRQAAGGNPITFFRQPVRHLSQNGLWEGEARQAELLTLLNLVRNSSHRSVIETALSVETGEIPDNRTPEIEQHVRELLSWTEDQAIYNRPSTAGRKLDELFDRFRER